MAAESAQATSETARITPTEESDQPPPYNSIYGRLKSVRDESTGPKELVANSCDILCASVVGTILLAPVLAVPIAMIVIGAIYLHDCPAERYIPIYLVVGGCFGALQTLLTFFLRIRNHRENKDEKDCERQAGEGTGEEGHGRGRKSFKDTNARPNPGSGIISCFLFAWFIAGSVWVYSIYSTVNTSNAISPNYCHPSAYWFAFVLITIGYAGMALACCCATFCGILACVFSKD